MDMGVAPSESLIRAHICRCGYGLCLSVPGKCAEVVLGQGQKGQKKRSARSGGVVRKQVATVEKFLPWWTPETLTEEISISV